MDKETMERLSTNVGVIQDTMPTWKKWHVMIRNDDPGAEPLINIAIDVPETEEARELLFWWIKTATSDFTATMPKTQEYGGDKPEGSADLILIGENLAVLLGMHDADDAMKQELGCWFYMQGKIARLVSNYQQHQSGKSDTWFDAVVYGMMARRLQAAGRWP